MELFAASRPVYAHESPHAIRAEVAIKNKSHGETQICKGQRLLQINLTMRHEYTTSNKAYLSMQTIRKGVKTVRRDDSDFRVIMHYPESEEMKRELAKRVATVHAQTVMEKLSTLSCPVEQKAQLLDAIIAKRRGHTR